MRREDTCSAWGCRPLQPPPTRGRMKRRIAKLTVLLVLGAIINVAVAWGCAAWGSSPLQSANRVDCVSKAWPIAVPNDWKTPRSGSKYHGFGSDVVFVVGQETLDPPELLMFRAGWPTRSMSWHAWLDTMRNARGFQFYETGDIWADGIDLQPADADHYMKNWRRLPVRPIWAGSALNTILYAAIIWLLFFAPFKLRRWRRIKRGLCPACAYHVGASETCTECGNPIAVKTA